MGVHRLSVIPRALVDRSNPPPESDDDEGDECLEYDVYGWFKFESDADGVQRLDRQWVPLHDLEQAGRRLEGGNFEVGGEAEEGQQCSDFWKNTSTFTRVIELLVGCSNCAGTGSNQSRGIS